MQRKTLTHVCRQRKLNPPLTAQRITWLRRTVRFSLQRRKSYLEIFKKSESVNFDAPCCEENHTSGFFFPENTQLTISVISHHEKNHTAGFFLEICSCQLHRARKITPRNFCYVPRRKPWHPFATKQVTVPNCHEEDSGYMKYSAEV